VVLQRALARMKKSWEAGEHDAAKLVAMGREEIAGEKSVRLDYLEIVDPDSLDPVGNLGDRALAAVAAFLGSTRLIDNILLSGSGQ
jgi:pantothenate synthetase